MAQFYVPDGRTHPFAEMRDLTRPDTRHKMRLVCVLFTFENNGAQTDLRTDGHELLSRCVDASKNQRNIEEEESKRGGREGKR